MECQKHFQFSCGMCCCPDAEPVWVFTLSPCPGPAQQLWPGSVCEVGARHASTSVSPSAQAGMSTSGWCEALGDSRSIPEFSLCLSFPLQGPACPRHGHDLSSPWLSVHGACGLGLGSWRLRGWSLGRDRVELKSEERSAGLFLGFLFPLTKGLDHSQTGAGVSNGSCPRGLAEALANAPSDCQRWSLRWERSVQEQ